MASIYTNTNVNAFNPKQVRQAAVNVGVITEKSANHPPAGTPASLITAVKAK